MDGCSQWPNETGNAITILHQCHHTDSSHITYSNQTHNLRIDIPFHDTHRVPRTYTVCKLPVLPAPRCDQHRYLTTRCKQEQQAGHAIEIMSSPQSLSMHGTTDTSLCHPKMQLQFQKRLFMHIMAWHNMAAPISPFLRMLTLAQRTQQTRVYDCMLAQGTRGGYAVHKLWSVCFTTQVPHSSCRLSAHTWCATTPAHVCPPLSIKSPPQANHHLRLMHHFHSP